MLAHVARFEPQFLILQCGADSVAGDPLTNLLFTPAAHAQAARDLCALADRLQHGRMLALGGGGYDRGNLARGLGGAWSRHCCACLGFGYNCRSFSSPGSQRMYAARLDTSRSSIPTVRAPSTASASGRKTTSS